MFHVGGKFISDEPSHRITSTSTTDEGEQLKNHLNSSTFEHLRHKYVSSKISQSSCKYEHICDVLLKGIAAFRGK